MGWYERITGVLNSKEVKKLEKTADQIEAYDESMRAMSDEELRAKTSEFRARLGDGETLDDLLPEAYAVCREAAARVLGLRPFRVQLMGAVVLHQGRIAEMKTGEGKTLAATLPAYLNALEGKGVHIITVNDYLAKRDAEWMGRLYDFLGLTVGCVTDDEDGEDRRAQYDADITYGTNSEFGFDYLRDNMAVSREELVQRGLNFAIVDEVDSILIDEARTPLIISGRGTDSGPMCQKADAFVKTLREKTDYRIDEKDRQIAITEAGVESCERWFGIDNFSDPDNLELNHYVQQALRANYIMKRDVDYIVEDGEVMIVDEFTGRIMYGRRFSNGLHQAIEAKENVKVLSEDQTLATITLQNYFRMYGKLAGMTGTAKTEESEFREIYNMDVVVIPTDKPVRRTDHEDVVFAREEDKFAAVTDAVAELHESGRPVLVGTVSVEVSERLSKSFRKRGIKHHVLNAKNHAREAEIVADAGRLGAVTIATNMAGRGTDIILGGNPEFEARRRMRKQGFTEEELSFATGYGGTDDAELQSARETYRALCGEIKQERASEQEEVKELGGLVIIGTERHEARRIDNQLRGRSGRQGDPGETRFMISLEDEIPKRYGGERIRHMLEDADPEYHGALETGKILRTIESAQKTIEDRNFYTRKYVLQYDDVKNRQREVIYRQRRAVLDGEDLSDEIKEMMHELAGDIVDSVTSESRFPEEWDLEQLEDRLERTAPGSRGRIDLSEGSCALADEASLRDAVMSALDGLYEEKEAGIGSGRMRELERMMLLRTIDSHWIEHIDAMEQLEEGIGLRGLGQEDPAMAFSREGYDMFAEMTESIKADTVRACLGAGRRRLRAKSESSI